MGYGILTVMQAGTILGTRCALQDRSVTLIKIKKKKGVSNKEKTLGNVTNFQTQSAHLSTPASLPFIDRIYLVIKVPNLSDGTAIYSNLWSQMDDKDAFQPSKKSSGYQLARRIVLPSVEDLKKHPHMEFGIEGKLVTRIRLDFVPVDLQGQAINELKAALTSLLPDGWFYFREHARITRLDVAVDFPQLQMDEFHVLPAQGLTTTSWRSNGALQTFQLGKTSGNHTSIYDRGAKRKAKGKGWQGKNGVRVERRLKKISLPLSELGSLDNPLEAIAFVKRSPPAPPEEKKPFIWSLFLHAASANGLPHALALLPIDKRTMYRKHLAKHPLEWWDAVGTWKNWPTQLHSHPLFGSQH